MNSAGLLEQFADKACIAGLDDEGRARLAARPRRGVPGTLWEKFGYAPNDWAYCHLHTSGARYNTLTTCRQCGKTEALALEIAEGVFAPAKRGDKKAVWNDCTDPVDGQCSHPETDGTFRHDGRLLVAEPNYVGLVSFDFSHAGKPVFRFIQRFHETFGANAYTLNKNEHTFVVKDTLAKLEWFSAEAPLSVQGNTFTVLLWDEAQNIPDEMWNNARPALDVRMARIVVAGTPDPLPTCTWFKGLFLKGQDPDATDYYSYTLACWDNQWCDVDTIIDARSTMTEAEFRKKYLGQWVDDGGMVFRNVDANFTGSLEWTEENAPKGPYVIGLDLAKHDDYTVAYVVERKTQRVVDRYRINRLDYTEVEDRVEELSHKWHAQGIMIDATREVAVADGLRKRNLIVWEFVFSEKSKAQLVTRLARELEHGRCILPTEDKQLQRELKAYMRVISKAGNVQYTAPVNYNDDCVMALGLALLKAKSLGAGVSQSYL